MPDFWERWKYLTSADVAVRNCVQTEICAFELQDGAGLNPDFKLNWRSSCFRGRYINKASLDFCHLTWDIKIYHFKDQPSVIKVISVIEHKWRARILALMSASPEVLSCSVSRSRLRRAVLSILLAAETEELVWKAALCVVAILQEGMCSLSARVP